MFASMRKGDNTMKTALIAAVLMFAGVAAILPAQANDQNWSRTKIEVPYGDLDLSRPEDAKTMLHRIMQAASRACGKRPDIRDRWEQAAYAACVRNATSEAVARLRAPLVTALYEAYTRLAGAGSTPR
jgi:UrcA family protein